MRAVTRQDRAQMSLRYEWRVLQTRGEFFCLWQVLVEWENEAVTAYFWSFETKTEVKHLGH